MGGSVNEENAKELSQISGVNGFLVGGASLDPQKFFNIYLKTDLEGKVALEGI